MGGLIWTFDPGQETGWAVGWRGALISCGLLRITADDPVGLEPILNASAIPPQVWIETPEYRRERNKVDPNDLIALGIKVGRIRERCLVLGYQVGLVRPMAWKGSVPKEIHHDRIRKDLGLQERKVLEWGQEGVAKGLTHNILDAVGMYIWAAKREGSRK